MSAGKRLTTFDDLSPEQQEVVRLFGQGMAVLAGAGSGKTTTLVIKCEELLKRNPEARFAAVSFTERSASDLRAKLAARLGPGGLARHWVMTIHGLCGTILREYAREAGFDGEETMLSEPEAQTLWERAVSALFEDDLAPETTQALERMLLREGRDGLLSLLRRVRELESFGALSRLADAGDPDGLALAATARFVLDRYERLKRRRGALDFNDLERGADRALDDPRVRAALQSRFDLVLVDEFQDTNPLQASIVRRLVRPDRSNLCVVGDPKQSIYRFRDADVTVFEEFCRGLPVRLSLTWNFRSRAGIIEYVNRVCAPAFAASSLEYQPLEAKRSDVAREECGHDAVERLDVSSPEDLARWIRGEVSRGLALDKMALLLRRIRGNEKWLKALASEGIPVAVGSGGLFWEDPRVRELVAFLKWWDNPGNRLSGAVFLRAPWVGISDRELDRWAREGDLSDFFEKDHPIAHALKLYRSGAARVVRPGELLMQLLVSEEVEAEIGAPMLGLWHRCEDLSSRGLDFHAVVVELARAVEEGRRERDVPPPANQGSLSVLTLHGSKGLEFDHVILIDLGGKPRAGDAPLLFWDRAKGALLGIRDENGDRDRKHPVEIAWRDEERRKSLAESNRLFYVALTRARERLVLACPELGERDEGKLAEILEDRATAYDCDWWRAWIEVAPGLGGSPRMLEPAIAAGPAIPPKLVAALRPATAPSGLMLRPRHSVTEWNLMSRCARSYEWTFIRPRQLSEGLAAIGAFTGTRPERPSEEEVSQKDLGTRVHRCLELGDYDGLRALESEVGPDRLSADPLISWAMSSDWMVPAALDRGREVWTELSFEIPIEHELGREVLVGSIDRFVLDASAGGAPSASLIDFKITGKPKSVEALTETYRSQIELYAWALGRLEPSLLEADVSATLVNISARTIQAVPVRLEGLTQLEERARQLAAESSRIVNGAEGLAQPGPVCRNCDFRRVCEAGRGYLAISASDA